MSKEITGFRPGSKSWKNFMSKLYGIGGAVVIIGALFKLQHYPGSGPMLILGLGVEAFIFFFSAFEPLHDEPKWELVYPELSENEIDELPDDKPTKLKEKEKDLSTTQELDLMLENAKIGPELIEGLGKGMKKLSKSVDSMNEIGSISDSSVGLVESLNGASDKINDLSTSYEKASESLKDFSIDKDLSEKYAENVIKINENLSSLNSVYELQLKNTQEQLDNSNQAQEGIKDLLESLNSSVEYTRNYKDSVAELSNNLASLNSIYGNMLNAMNYNKQ